MYNHLRIIRIWREILDRIEGFVEIDNIDPKDYEKVFDIILPCLRH